MNVNELVHRFEFPTKIYDASLPKKLHDAMSAVEHEPRTNLYYKLEINFNSSVYKDPSFFQYPFRKAPLSKGGKAPNKEDLIGYILADQLEAIEDTAKSFGYDFLHTDIMGKSSIGSKVVEVLIGIDMVKDPPEFDNRGKEIRPFRCNRVMPDYDQVIAGLAKSLYEMFKRDEMLRLQEEFQRNSHVPNMVDAKSFFSVLARALLPYTPEETPDHLADKLRASARLISQYPLDITSAFSADFSAGQQILPSTAIDCPEIIIFQRFKSGRWIIMPIDSLKEVQQFIKTTLQYKKTNDPSRATDYIVVLQNLEPKPYSLFMETDNGIEKIEPCQITKRMKLHVSWEKAE